MHLVCIFGLLMIVFAAAESCPYDANPMCDMEHAVTSEESEELDPSFGSGSNTSHDHMGDGCTYSKKFDVKCCVCVKAITKYLPIVDALLIKKIKGVCNANWFIKGPCIKIAFSIKDKVIEGFFKGGPLKSCIKYKMCR